MANQRAIYITKLDYERLTDLIHQFQGRQIEAPKHLEQLEAELKRAKIVSPKKIAPDVITMNSTIRLKDTDTGEVFDYRLVYPQEADPEKRADFSPGAHWDGAAWIPCGR